MQPEPKNAKVVGFREAQQKFRRKSLPAVDAAAESWRIRSNIAALLFSALLIAVGWMLVQKLGASARIQDCLMSGRTNCAPIIVSAPQQ